MTRIGPFDAIKGDFTRADGYRILLSGAYNAGGLIGPEMNGIAVLDEQTKSVITDCIGRQDSGWYGESDAGPGKALQDLFEILKYAAPADFATAVNILGQERMRGHFVEDRTDLVMKAMIDAIDASGVDAAIDALSDALHEAADRADIPEGEDRDAWRAEKMEAFGFSDRTDLQDQETLARALVEMGVQRAEIESAETFLRP